MTLDGKCVQSGVESFKKHSNSAPTSTPPGRAVSWRTSVPAIPGSPGTYSNPAILDFGSSSSITIIQSDVNLYVLSRIYGSRIARCRSSRVLMHVAAGDVLSSN